MSLPKTGMRHCGEVQALRQPKTMCRAYGGDDVLVGRLCTVIRRGPDSPRRVGYPKGRSHTRAPKVRMNPLRLGLRAGLSGREAHAARRWPNFTGISVAVPR